MIKPNKCIIKTVFQIWQYATSFRRIRYKIHLKSLPLHTYTNELLCHFIHIDFHFFLCWLYFNKKSCLRARVNAVKKMNFLGHVRWNDDCDVPWYRANARPPINKGIKLFDSNNIIKCMQRACCKYSRYHLSKLFWLYHVQVCSHSFVACSWTSCCCLFLNK